MWYDPATETRYGSHADIRAAYPQVSFPATMSDAALADVGLVPVLSSAWPTHDPNREELVELLPTQVNGAWVQLWRVDPLPPETISERLQARREAMVISRFQGEAALYQAGLLDDVEALIAGADPLVQIAWQRVTEFRRLSPMIASIAQALGWTDEQLDALFETAA